MTVRELKALCRRGGATQEELAQLTQEELGIYLDEMAERQLRAQLQDLQGGAR